jgi:hypothetical protein
MGLSQVPGNPEAISSPVELDAHLVSALFPDQMPTYPELILQRFFCDSICAAHRRNSLEFYFLNQPGQAEIQSDLFYDYRTNVDAYPKWQSWMREKQPRLFADHAPHRMCRERTTFLH